MPRRERIIQTEPLGFGRHLTISVSYHVGGMNYFSGVQETRGYYLHVTPFKESDGIRLYEAFSGYKSLLQPAARFHAPTLATLTPPTDLIERLRAKVLARIAPSPTA